MIIFASSMRFILSIILLLVMYQVNLAQVDSLPVPDEQVFVNDTSRFHSAFRKNFSSRWHMRPHSPMKATLFSAMVPAMGQIYNGHHREGSLLRKYWKVPIVLGGVGTCIAFIDFNTGKYRYYRREYIAYSDDDPNTIPSIEANVSQLEKVQDQYHRWMDVSYMALVGVYLLQILDANVDAHLFYFDVGKELSLEFRPAIVPVNESLLTGIGISFKLRGGVSRGLSH